MNPILSVEEVAELLRCSARTVEDFARNGRIPGYKFGECWVFASDLVVDAVKRLSLEEAERRRQQAIPNAVKVAAGRPKGRRRVPGLSLLPPDVVAQIVGTGYHVP